MSLGAGCMSPSPTYRYTARVSNGMRTWKGFRESLTAKLRRNAQSSFNSRGFKHITTAGSNKGFQLLEWAGDIVPQGQLVKGAKFGWKSTWEIFMRELAPQDSEGGYQRPSYSFNTSISNQPNAPFPVESGRYHLYTGNACPWCHRCLLVLALRGLTSHISQGPLQDDAEVARRGGWIFKGGRDPITGSPDLYGVYAKAKPGFQGRCTAPLLWDKKTSKIVSNDSASIVRMLNSVNFNPSDESKVVDLYPVEMEGEIDRMNAFIYNKINNGTYKSGFATTQSAYDRAQKDLYEALDEVESILSKQRFLVGERFTESDLFLFPTLMRFDSAYAVLFKCSRKRVADYPNISAWMRDVYQLPAPEFQVRDTFDVDDARRSYFEQLFPLNPSGIVPSGPTLEDMKLDDPADRGSREVDDLFYFKEL